MIYTIFRGILNTVSAAPRAILTIAFAWFFIASSCGVLGWPAIRTEQARNGFFIIFGFFVCVAVVLLLFGLAKWAMWRQRGLRETLPDGTVLLQLEHTLDVQTRERVMLGARETTRSYRIQPVFVSPPPAEQQIPVQCATCQQEVLLRAMSLPERSKWRLQTTLWAILMLALTGALEAGAYFIASGSPGNPLPGYLHFGSIVLLLVGVIGIVRLLNYRGVTLAKAPVGHRLTQPSRENLEMFYAQMSVQR
jgi:hypothetical protein